MKIMFGLIFDIIHASPLRKKFKKKICVEIGEEQTEKEEEMNVCVDLEPNTN